MIFPGTLKDNILSLYQNQMIKPVSLIAKLVGICALT